MDTKFFQLKCEVVRVCVIFLYIGLFLYFKGIWVPHHIIVIFFLSLLTENVFTLRWLYNKVTRFVFYSVHMKNKLPVPFVLSNHNGKWLNKEQIRFRFSGKHVHSGEKCLPRVACLWSKMPMFQRGEWEREESHFH